MSFACALAALLFPFTAPAQQATPNTEVGDTVTHPVTGIDSTVIQVIPGYVVTDSGDLFMVQTTVGYEFEPDDPATTEIDESVTIASVTTNADTGLVESLNLSNGDTVLIAGSINLVPTDEEDAAQGAPGAPGGETVFVPPVGSGETYRRFESYGDNGSDGDDGWGTEVCDPTGWFSDDCAFIGDAPEDGGNGVAPDAINVSFAASDPDFQTTSADRPGIAAVSWGGTGGQGGDIIGNYVAGIGGAGGPGGTVNITSFIDISTSGAESHGIFAQSRSGKAGAGGEGYIFGSGGSGGTAGQGGTVNVTNGDGGVIGTGGNGAHGIYVISMGGSAGPGGDSWGFVGEGGSSRAGGSGGFASVTNNGDIVTVGNGSHGIFAQSIGGTGGDGGDAGGIVALGGAASVGGNGGTVNVTNGATADIVTHGEESIGVLAQSIGGGGGNGGFGAAIAAFGGTGAGGGNGGSVTVTNLAGSTITTEGADAHGVLAQSIGGGGGVSGTVGGAVAIGNQSGGGGNGGQVTIDSNAGITTSGTGARGLFAQSIGGGGGAANGAGGIVTLGGQGGGGGNGNVVSVENGGGIDTLGLGADALFAQSVGGGGGSGATAGGVVALGGSGGGGGSSGAVSVSNSGDLSTAGHFARGIFAQSVGGGGGTGGFSGALVALGGTGSAGGGSNTVEVDNSGSIATAGINSSAIQAQSIGGGGGDGGTTGSAFLNIGGNGDSGGSSSSVTVNSSGDLVTNGRDSHGIFAQSVGGGGGNGANAAGGSLFAGASIGGDGSSGGDGAAVNVTTTARTVVIDGVPTMVHPLIRTSGDRSHGIYAQSVGGGGGNGGFAVQATGGTFISVAIAVGGAGGDGGDGADVTVDSTASILTQGADSFGLLAQSIGGGGGNGGFSIAGALQLNPVGGGAIAVGVGGSGGAGGVSGVVDLDFSGSVNTGGERATGVLAQSLGGGGGNGGFNIAAPVSISGVGDGSIGVGVGGTGGAGGAGNEVHASVDGSVITAGDDAVGVHYQSVGGGGGNGGFNIGAGVSAAGVGSGAINVGVGGSGDVGGAGDTVDGDVYGRVETSGERAGAIIMQSIGGGGGNGGFNINVAAAGAGVGSGTVGVGLGGNGAGGGAGGSVTALMGADVSTAGDDSDGVLVQSVGGGGGNGGFNITVPLNVAGVGNGSVTVGLGGEGAGGGAGGAVDADFTGTIHTVGTGSEGMIAQSIGGGGGNGGFAINVSGAGAGVGSGTVSVGLGGKGGTGSNAGEVTASFGGSLLTEGADSTGLLFQSVGGGGGNGGFAITAALNGAGVGNGAVSVGLGGKGGGGGNGDRVEGTVGEAGVTATIGTLGEGAAGIIMQSIGGGGGNGGFNINTAIAGAGVGSGSVSVGLGGEGGSGGNGGAVDADLFANVSTEGAGSDAVLIQSVGGGGGNGGFDITVPLNGAGVGNGAVGVGLGGSGGDGGDGGIIETASFAGAIYTAGEDSDGYVVQSIGGGGGNGGFQITGTGAGAGVGSGSVSVSIGGSGGAAGLGGAVTADLDGSVVTEGNDAFGILFQSVGGGGGNGGFSVNASINGAGVGNGAVSVGVGGAGGAGGTGGTVDGTVNAAVSTAGDRSDGIVMQAIGGGGGNGGFTASLAGAGSGVGTGAVTVGVGGAGADGGIASGVTGNVTGSVVTTGEDADGVLLQSVGGGGGNGGFNIALAGAGAGVGSGTIGVGVGGSGGVGGTGGTVDAIVAADIHTAGDYSGGLIAQSIGGGGGDGGFNVSVSGSGAGVGSGGVGVGVGGTGGAGGDSSNVTASYTGTAVTEGSDATAVLFQTVGGGGGNGGFNVGVSGSGAGTGSGAVNVSVGGAGAGGGNAGALHGTAGTEDARATIVTVGTRSDGVVMQSVGGGGGNGGFSVSVGGSGAGVGSGGVGVGVGGSGGAGGNGGEVTAFMDADVNTYGFDADAVLVQSVGGGGGSGGFDVSVGGSGAGTGSGAVGVSVGGSGGDGGDAAEVQATLAGNVVTLGDQSDGVTVQSVGGGGGSGGFSVGGGVSGAGTGSGAVSVGVGGSGGDGGLSSLVDASFAGTVHTDGDDSIAVLFQSVGGGGGSGGFSIGGGVSGAGTGSGGVGVGIGGSGGLGGAGGGVLGEVVADVSTAGSGASGVVAQSIGGGGGQGGLTVGGGISGAGTGSGAVSVGVGGSGGEGGDASFVDARYEGTAVTTGDDATAVLFQSIGGGGGQGGISIAGAISGAGTGGGTVAVSVGGSGGKGGHGGTVDGVVLGDVVTTGSEASAIVVQSIGGGGGNGGIAVAGAISGAGKGSGSVAVGIGGSGDTGGDAGAVTSDVTGDVISTGSDSDAIVVQSLGGGGGNGALSVAGAISGAGTGSGAASVGVGGAGGGGGSAGAVQSTVLGDVVTEGSGAGGIVVQSLGGGGGNGGINVSGAISLARTGTAGVAVGVGGFGGTGGAASTVFSDLVGNLITEGDDATGILAQSLGGGGGNGGLNISGAISASNNGSGAAAVGVGGFGGDGGSAATVTSNLTGDIVTYGAGSDAFVAQSLGGGGGNGGLNVSGAVSLAKSSGGAVGIGVGGFGGKGGNGGDVNSTLTGQIETSGAGATGILLQSLGGGGGNGGVNVAAGLNLSLQNAGAGVGIGVGGFGGEGGSAANVNLLHTGNVLTTGAESGAVTAQSLGGGGGNGGINVAAGLAATNKGNAFAVGLGVGGFGGLGGSAGNVDVTVDGSIVAAGLGTDEIVTVPAFLEAGEELVPALTSRVRSGGSHGVLAQSIGGGGGNGGLNVSAGVAIGAPGSGKSYGLSLGVGGFGGGGGDAGTVAVTVESGGVVSAIGDDASAIAAQSIGGGGGNGGLNVSGGISMDGTIAVGVGGFGGDGGLGGDVTVTSDTAVVSAGSNAAGILAQSIGGGGGNGGINISGGITPQTKSQGKSVSMVFGVGGFGGAGDASGNVLVGHAGTIHTAGAAAHGILAQSIAGGGGNGALNVSGNVSGNSKFAFAGGVGGHGGAGADAGTVTVVSDGNITTSGGIPGDGTVLDLQATSGNGILAQSIGGGGGNGGMNVSGVFALKGSPVSFGLGGFGSGGGNAGGVSVTHGGLSDEVLLIATRGEDSAGIVAQSIGGGGGNAGANFLGSVTLGAGGTGSSGGGTGLPDANRCDGWDPRLVADNCVNWDKVIAELDKRKPSKNAKSTVAVQIAIGGRGGEAGHAGTATVDHIGNIVTVGDRSEGIVAQSIGGGGGNAAVNIGMAYAGGGVGVDLAVGGAPGDGGTGDTVNVKHEGDITTSGIDAAGIFAQSIGGGGGDVATNLVRGTTAGGTISVTLGRIGGTGGAGGDVTLASNGTVTTLGDGSVGLLAQSVGNGGGKSGSSSIALGKQGKKPKKPNPVGLTLALGLEGGAGGTAGTVGVTARGRVQTDGDASHAILAQSVGGGGGISSMEMTPEVTSSNLVLTQGGTGGTGGTSGEVSVDNFAELLTLGASSKGVFAQSIGGGGGLSEMSVDGGWESGAGGAVIALGGSGGAGAVSGAVTVSNSGVVATEGEESTGIHAQSIGGGGGNAELSFSGQVSAEKSGAMSLSVAVGGDGGTGAAAGAASVTNSGRISTLGAAAAGIVAQSIGGGGGNGDLEAELQLDSESGSTQLGLAFGGTGGSGGTGGNVSVANDATGIITTVGDDAHGILAQSIGGGGGNSASKVSTSAVNGTQNFSLGFGVGGSGGVGGTGGDVNVTNAGLVETGGDGAHGIFAESIGGGGGNGEMHLVSNIALTAIPTATGVNPLLGIGGTGGNGNDGGAVRVENSGQIVTHGAASHGIVAKSIGGGGGDATLAIGAGLTTGDLGPVPAPETDPLTDPVSEEFTLAGPLLNQLGGTGGEGALGGEVTVVHTGDITTWGEGSEAIVAQSINGGGGHMRFGLTGVTDLTGEAGVYFELGADETQDSVASRVSVTSTGTVTMMGDNSVGHGLQSIGGGGGTLDFTLDTSGQSASSGTLVSKLEGTTGSQAEAAAPLPIGLTLGGSGGSRNGGGDIATEHEGDIGSVGKNAHGMAVQTIGGGGGRAFMDVTTAANAGVDLSVVLGGTGGTNEAGGAIALQRNGGVLTEGDRAFGTSAQSIGGGGGMATIDLSVAANDAAANEGQSKVAARVPHTAAGAAPHIHIVLGANSGSGLDGGDMTLGLNGDLLTEGRQAHGLFFQSIGAGGGVAQVSGSGGAVNVTLGGADGASGNGGDIELVNDGNVWTNGWMAHAVFLQSIGGGGGAAFTDLNGSAAAIDLGGAGAGDGGAIAFAQTGDIKAQGDAAYGIFLQSLGGGGGAVDRVFAGAAGGAGAGGGIDLEVAGSVLAPGDAGTAIFAQSEGADGGGDITIDLAGGHSVVGGAGGSAIELRGGNDNAINNRGYLGTTDGILGTAIVSGASPVAANDTVVNFDTVTGSVLLGGGDNFFRNEAGAVFNMGSRIELDSARPADSKVGTFTNFGTLQSGGVDRLMEVQLDGNFVQGDSGLMFAEYDLSRTSETVQADRLSISGSALVAGTVELSLWNPGYVMPGQHNDILLSAEGGVGAWDPGSAAGGASKAAAKAAGLVLTGVPDSVVASFELTWPNASDVVLSSNIDFSPIGLNSNQSSLGEYVNGIQLAGGAEGFAPLAAELFFTDSLTGLQQTYDSLSPVVHAEALSHTLLSSARFGDQLMECRERDGDYRFGGEGQCRWFRFARRFLDRDATSDNFAYEQDGIELSGGFQAEVAPGRLMAFGASFTRSQSTTGRWANGESDLLQLGVTMKQRLGDLKLTGALSGGHGWFDTSRYVRVPGLESGTAVSSPGVDFFSARGRISHDTLFDDWYLRTIMDAGLNYLHLPRFAEKGVRVVAVDVAEQNRTFLSLQPAIEFGGEFRTSADLLLRPYGRAGILYLGGDTSPQVTARFLGAPAGVAGFAVTAGMDRFYGDVALGLDVLSLDGNVFRVEGNGQFGSHTRSYGIEFNWTLGFE